MKAIFEYFKRQIDEIRNDEALRLYGPFLALGPLLAYSNWREHFIPKFIAKVQDPICWPFFETCYKYRFLSIEQADLLLNVFGILSTIGIFLFLSRKLVPLAYWWMVGITLFKTAIYVLDYRLVQNQHYMLYFVTFVYLFMPHKRDLLRYIIVGLYVGAGCLKVNHEWLSGAALYKDLLWIHGRFVPPACAYALVLELFLVFGILLKNKWVFWLSFFQLCLFHLVSFPVVGPFYPLLMFGILAIFPLTFVLADPQEKPGLLKGFFSGQQAFSTYCFIGLFILGQLVPKIMPGDERLTGEGRMFSLSMFDAQVICDGALTVKFRDGTTQTITLPAHNKHRIKCDPILNLSLARNQCLRHQDDPNFENVDFFYTARLSTEKEAKPLVDIPDFCSKDIDYKMWRPNDWILKHD